MHEVFYVSLLKQDITKKGWMDEKVTKFETGNNKEYEVEGIWDSAVYTKESAASHLQGLYYLIFWKGYPKEENIWEPASVVQHLRKLLSALYKDNPGKPTATSPPVDTVPPIAWPHSKPIKAAKQKRSQLVPNT